jgi:hypothetical protein
VTAVATTRGFIERIEVGRGGLVRATLVNSTTRAVFTVSDIDGDPERFNERLTKVSVLRDAMNRAEPVEIEHKGGGDGGNEIDRVARVSRDELLDDGPLSMLSGLVLDLVVESRNDLDGDGEAHDVTRVRLMALDAQTHDVRLDLQAPERLVAVEQLRMLRDAIESGTLVQLLVATADDGAKDPEIVSVRVGAGVGGRDGKDQERTVSGFVETLGTMLPAAVASAAGSLALTRITTGPELTGVGGAVSPDPFAPQGLSFFVARGSVVYALLEAAVRENDRVRVSYLPLPGAEQRDQVEFTRGVEEGDVAGAVEATAADEGDGAVEGLLLSAELQAPLSSASRPVWVRIDREMLDVGPASDCVPGLPSTSLRPRTLRDLRIPYPAEWIGQGCFNHGVYRFQLTAPTGSVVLVDDEAICLFPAGDAGVVAGHACLEGDHVVTVQIPEYVCDTEFDLDVFRVR